MRRSYLIRVPIVVDKLSRWGAERGWFRRGSNAEVYDEGRVLHHLLYETFGVAVLHPFRFLVAAGQRDGNLYGYSELDAAQLRQNAQEQALPEHLDTLNLNRLDSKLMPNNWNVGQELGFDLRIRPVRRLKNEIKTTADRYKKGREIDAFLLEALREHPTDSSGMAIASRSRESVYLDWLSERLEPIATVNRDSSRLVKFQRSRIARGSHVSEGPDAIVHGSLFVKDVVGFSGILAKGVGRHKGYGYGMLLLRSPSALVPRR